MTYVPPSAGSVSKVFGRSGDVVQEPNDYVASYIDNDSTVVGDNVAEALDTLKSVDLSSVSGTLGIDHGGTGQVTAQAARNALLPSQSSNTALVSDGSNVSFSSIGLATDIISGTLPTSKGGTGVTSSGIAGRVLRSDGSSWQSASLAVSDVSGAAPSLDPTFSGTVTATGATSVLVPSVAYPDNSSKAAPTSFVTEGLATKIGDAPSDGSTYGRNNATWTTVTSGISDAPVDGNAYVRKNASWSNLQTEVANKVNSSGGTLTDGQIAGPTGTTISGTLTAGGSSVIDLDGASTVFVPTASPGTNDTKAASTAFVTNAISTAVGGSSAIPLSFYTTGSTGTTATGTGLVSYINTTTPSLAAGTYYVEWSVICTHTSTGSSLGAQLTLGVTQVPTPVIEGYAVPAAGGRTRVSASGFYTHAGGTLLVVVQIRRSAGSGNLNSQYGEVLLRRIA